MQAFWRASVAGWCCAVSPVRIERGTARLGTVKSANDKIRRIAVLLADLRRDNTGLADVDQPWLDDWVHDHPSARPDVRVFLDWARRHGLVSAQST